MTENNISLVSIGMPVYYGERFIIEAAIEFAQSHPDFVIEQPSWVFYESELNKNITHWPGAWLRKIIR